jgi:hypothetical protein
MGVKMSEGWDAFRRASLLLVVVGAGLVGAPAASATTTTVNFDPPTYTTGMTPRGQTAALSCKLVPLGLYSSERALWNGQA